jgi:hypothetical protein
MKTAYCWHIESNVANDGSWKPELRARSFTMEGARAEAARLNVIAERKGVSWRYRAAPDGGRP